MDEFEQYLSQQPLRALPPHWRHQIVPDRSAAWREWLWPSPLAWATVAAAWLMILSLHLACLPAPDNTTRPAENGAAWASRQQLLVEITGDPS